MTTRATKVREVRRHGTNEQAKDSQTNDAAVVRDRLDRASARGQSCSRARRRRRGRAAPAPASAAALPPALAPPAAAADSAAPAPPCERRGPIHRLIHHTAHTLEDKFIGYPNAFIEPPLGFYAAEQLTVQVGKADSHRFMLYRTDFLPGTNVLSPIGASRFNIMLKRVCGWPGPVTIEWTPDQPAVAEVRRQAVLAMLQQTGQPIIPERVVVGPSPYPGGLGVEPANFYNNMTIRSQLASPAFALPPIESASSGVRVKMTHSPIRLWRPGAGTLSPQGRRRMEAGDRGEGTAQPERLEAPVLAARRASVVGVLSIALLGSGCLGVPTRPPAPDPPPPQAPQNSAAPSSVDDSQREQDGKNESRATATPRQKFHVHIEFGRIFESQGNCEAAINEYQDALTVIKERRHTGLNAADEALAHRRIAGAMDKLGRFAQAEVHYKQALKLSHKDPRIWNDAGYSYYLQGRFAEAETALKTALKLAPDDERIRTNLGLALAASGRSQEALPLLSRSTGDAAGHANLGYLLAATGQLELARQQYETALALRPDLTLARRALAQLDRQQKAAESPSAAPVQIASGAAHSAPPLDSDIQKVSPAETTHPNIPPPLPWLAPPSVPSQQ